MRNRTTDGATVTTPMRKLIKKLPDLAMRVCDRCFHAKEPVSHLDYNITLNYEFLDDINAGWFEDDTTNTGDDGHEDIVYKIKKALPENSTRQLQTKQNHPLILMVRIMISITTRLRQAPNSKPNLKPLVLLNIPLHHFSRFHVNGRNF
jgi:hypothetical protein